MFGPHRSHPYHLYHLWNISVKYICDKTKQTGLMAIWGQNTRKLETGPRWVRLHTLIVRHRLSKTDWEGSRYLIWGPSCKTDFLSFSVFICKIVISWFDAKCGVFDRFFHCSANVFFFFRPGCRCLMCLSWAGKYRRLFKKNSPGWRCIYVYFFWK